MATSGFRVRLEFPDGEQIVIGRDSDPVSVAIVSPSFWTTVSIFLNPGLRAGQHFVDGQWDVVSGDLTEFMRIIQLPRQTAYAQLYNRISDWRGPVFFLRQRVFVEWNRRSSSKHYDANKRLYAYMLDKSMQYSCAFFSLASSDDLEAAQRAKLEISIDRLRLDHPNLRVLDIGCGWGALAAEIAQKPEKHHVVGITLSSDQFDGALARRRALDDEVRDRLEFRLEDYASFMKGRVEAFDRIVSIGMFEHAGFGRHVHFYQSIRRSLAMGGRALIHSIIRPSPGAYNEWMRRYIFPDSFLPSLSEMIAGAERAGLIVDAVHVHPPSDYGKTLRAWRRRLEVAWPALQKESPDSFSERLRRTWVFYLASMEASFASDTLNFRVAQIELRKL